MGLVKLISNRISTEWKEKFNKNIDYLNDLEKKLSDQDKSTNSRIDNLVLHSGGESPNEVVDARVNNKGETFDTLQARLLKIENTHSEDVDTLLKTQIEQKNQLGQLNNAVGKILGGYDSSIAIYVSGTKGNDRTGDGTEDKPFQTIQAAANAIPLISTGTVTIFIDAGIYLEDVVFGSISGTLVYIRPIDEYKTLDPSKTDLPVKIRSMVFNSCTGYINMSGIQFVDTPNSPTYSLWAYQCGYISVGYCKFADNPNKDHMALRIEGTTKGHVHSGTYFKNQKVACYAKLLGELIVSDVAGSSNKVGVLSDSATVRYSPISNFASTPTKITGNGLIISNGQVLS